MVNWSKGLKCKFSYIFKFCEHTHVWIGLKEVMDLSTISHGGVS